MNTMTNLSSLTSAQIGQAFTNAGYMEMTPRTSTFVNRNHRGQFVYNCTWIDDDSGDEFDGESNILEGVAYVSVNDNGFIIAEC